MLYKYIYITVATRVKDQALMASNFKKVLLGNPDACNKYTV